MAQLCVAACCAGTWDVHRSNSSQGATRGALLMLLCCAVLHKLLADAAAGLTTPGWWGRARQHEAGHATCASRQVGRPYWVVCTIICEC